MSRSGLYDFPELQWEGCIQAIYRQHFPNLVDDTTATPAQHRAMLADVEIWLAQHPQARAQPWMFSIYGEDQALVEEWLADDPENNETPFNMWCVDHEDVPPDDDRLDLTGVDIEDDD